MGLSRSSTKTIMQHEIDVELAIHKILLLGTSASGKSTWFKSLPLTEEDETDVYTQIIRKNVVTGIITLIFQCNRLYTLYKYRDCLIDMTDTIIQTHIQTILNFKHESFENMNNLDQTSLNSLANSIDFVWNLDAVKYTWQCGLAGKYNTLDNLNYFLDNVHQIMDTNHKITSKNKLKTRIKTIGSHALSYRYKYDRYQVIDVGGSRVERMNWYQHFDKVRCVIFFVPLNDFCKRSMDDPYTNAMQENLQLFDEICNGRNFKNFGNLKMIILFTKVDLFRQHLMYIPLTCCFGKITESLIQFMFKMYENEMNIMISMDIRGLIVKYCYDMLHEYDFGWSENMNHDMLENCYLKSLNFITNRYLSVSGDGGYRRRSVYYYLVNLTDLDSVEKVMDDVHHSINPHYLQRGSLL